MKLEFFPEAEFELSEAAAFYDSRLRGLGGDFVAEVERVSGVILEHHSFGEKVDLVHKRVPLRRFPYALIFRLDHDVLRIVAVAHRRRRPSYWHSRVQDR